jgi:trehalose/maltose hydrolase-like predicted phosphorylase
VARSGSDSEGGIAVAAHDDASSSGDRRVVERLCAWVSDPNELPRFEDALERLAEVRSLGFDELLAEHREIWARRWADAEVVIEGSPEDELAARFNVFHLLSTAADADEAAVGARGLSGSAYGGHVFWDADVFVLPALAAIHPRAARAMLEYRIRRLGAARDTARARGLRGARFPWESAAEGIDVTPHYVRDASGKLVAIRTGQSEEHISADVAWAATRYAAWTGESEFLTGPGRDLVVDTARYWAGRVRLDGAGHGHIYGVIGPDEYHGPVDDNAYTNVMARWNLREGANLLSKEVDDHEAETWRSIADSLVDGWHPELGIYEQFAGYFDLEPLLVRDVAPPPPLAIDVLLGPSRVAGSQIVKQADVLMLHQMLPEEVEPGSLGPCLAFYEPRTAHGSSLSPSVHASLLARAGEPERALEMFRLGARLDLDDLTGTTAGGLHLASMGGTWQALAYGFLGLRAEAGVLEIDPCLPEAWDGLGLRFRFLGNPIRVHADHESVTVDCAAPVTVRIAGSRAQRLGTPGRVFRIEKHGRSAALNANRGKGRGGR